MTRVHRKPIDVGNGLICASVAGDGSLLSLATPDPRRGLVELSAAPAFPVTLDGNGPEVRAHRRRLTEPMHAVLRVADASGEATGITADGSPTWRLDGAGWAADLLVTAAADEPGVTMIYRLSAARAGRLRLRFRGRLDRPGYAEITPGGPVPDDLPPTAADVAGRQLRTSVLGSSVAVTAVADVRDERLQLGSWERSDEEHVLHVGWPDGTEDAELAVTVTMSGGAGASCPRPAAGSVPAAAGPETADVLDLVEAGALRYTVGCTALEVGPGHCCVITDHRLLPLSWTRDAYYQAVLLLAHGRDLVGAAAVVERHLAWLWEAGCDDEGIWRRSHLTTGAVKDTGYQVDQQLFPLLELADFRRATGHWPEAGRDDWGERVRRVWRLLPRHDGGLVPGEENPADDPSAFPYLLSSQLLLCYVARRLAELEQELGVADLRLADDAARTLASVRSAFACSGPYGPMWAYETDAEGAHRLYQDANDVPTALAPLWGLFPADDPLWLATMRFAFSEHNPGYVPGVHPGLGSAHTPGVWPLGDAQELAFAVATGDDDRRRRVLERVDLVASADGMLPETYDPDSGDWVARHWFAWPGSLLGMMNAVYVRGEGTW